MHHLTISYPDEILTALNLGAEEFETEARLLLAIKLYETGQLTTGLAAKVADIPRSEFIQLLGQYGLSPFVQDADELAHDLINARNARHRE